MMSDKEKELILRTPNMACPKCMSKKPGNLHTQEDFQKYHPLAGTGIDIHFAVGKAKE